MPVQFDVFLSHNSNDKAAVERIAQRLRAASLNPFLDKWHLIPGEPWQEAIEKALDNSKTTAVFFGPGGVGPWHNEEMRKALDTRAQDQNYRVIPVLLPGAKKPEKDLPSFVRRFTWVDFRDGLEDEVAFSRLLAGIRGEAPGGEVESQLEDIQRGKIFISYRRTDTSGYAGRLYDRLRVHFGGDNIFMDVEGLDPGVDFIETLEKAVSSCDVLIALIGNEWLTATDAKGQYRLDNPEDFVRLEIVAALERNVRVIPILVQGAQMPGSRDLPPALQRLSRLHALEIRHERFNADADRLVRAIETYLQEAAEQRVRQAAEKVAQEKAARELREREAAEKAALEQAERERRAQVIAQQEARIADYLKAAQSALEHKDWETARTQYRQILSLQPDHAIAQAGLRTALERLELARLYGQALLEQDSGHLEQALRQYQQIQAKEPGYQDVAERIVVVETALAKQQNAIPTSQTGTQELTQKLIDFRQTLPRWVWLGAVGILILVLVFWSGKALLPHLRGDETPSIITDDYGVPMVLIPAGPFEMGSQSGDSNKQPVHTVTLDAFYIDQYEVTNAHYSKCVDAGVCEAHGFSSHTRDTYYDNPLYDDYPVIEVNWETAQTYCEWRGARLPTEAEWEKAARGGLEGKLYPWGDESPVCQYNSANGARFDDSADCDDSDTEPVGSYRPNGYELYDMAGNVIEWVADWYASDYYANSPEKNPSGPDSGEYRVVRGGSWGSSDLVYLSVAHRDILLPSGHDNSIGFRCAGNISEFSLATTATTSTPEERSQMIADDYDVPMALVPAGSFEMGSEDGDDNEKSVHTVVLDAFYIDQYEVTNARYAECVAAGVCDPPSNTRSYTRGSYYGSTEYDDYPVIHVDWYDAQTYCQWRGARLPSEAEWEKAARGGLAGAPYVWGNETPVCDFGTENGAQSGDCDPDTVPVGSFAPNGDGLYDMTGNVWEWVMDWYASDYYANSPEKNPTGPISGDYRVLRGGSWGSLGFELQVAERGYLDPSDALDNLGFRCANNTDPSASSQSVSTTQVIQTPMPTETHVLPPEPSITPSPTPKELPALITDYGVPMALVLAGPFQMGSDADVALAECQKYRSDCERGWFEVEEPIHTVTLDDFYIDQYEVTNTRYAECVNAGVCNPPLDTSSKTHDNYYNNTDYANYPVINIDWDAAQTYCQWRGARLPTEAEWEKAARGGLDGALYPWGDTFDGALANYCDANCDYEGTDKDFDDGYEDTAPVGTYPSNGYGLFDMAGNVWEWTSDWYGHNYYASSPDYNPTGPETGEHRVVRGGAWYIDGSSLRTARRYYYASSPVDSVGFRCVRDALP